MLYRKLVQEWGTTYKGKGVFNFGPKVNPFPLVLGVLQKVFDESNSQRLNDGRVLVIVDTGERRNEFYNYITNTDNKSNNDAFRSLINKKTIKALSIDYAKTWSNYDEWYLLILVGINRFDPYINSFARRSKFNLICLTADTNTSNQFAYISTVADIAELTELKNHNTCPPVEEYQVPITITDEEELELLGKYDEFIRNSLSIFGEFANIGLALYGDSSCNISSMEYCTRLARKNGWSETLDMSVGYNKEIDKYYNPIAIQERAKLFYDIKSKRTNLVACNKSKLNKILEICKENSNKKILIINKNGDFAKTVTDFLNANLEHYNNGHRFYDPCYNYHDQVEGVYDVDDFGNVQVVKSGVNKGQKRIIKGKAQMSNAERYFNMNYTNILSTTNAPNAELECNIDILILTSPLCETIKSYLFRLNRVSFNMDALIAYKLYCMDTFEVNKLSEEIPTETHKIVNLCENNDDFLKKTDDFLVI